MMGNKDADDDDSMNAMFQEFMLKGKSGGRSTVTTPSPSSKKSSPRDLSSSSQSKSKSKRFHTSPYKKKGYKPILKAVQGRLQEWKENNDRLEQVMDSVINLRDRIRWESKQIHMMTSSRELDNPNSKLWRGSGFRSASSFSSSRSTSHLLLEDVELALDHDLLQHERMIIALRALVSSLAQALDAVGRRLDEWLLQDILEGSQPEEKELLDETHLIYTLAAQEVYQKQILVKKILDTNHDGVVDENSEQVYLTGKPRDVIKHSVNEGRQTTKRRVDSLVAKILSIP
jgi:hypothetical protein